MAGGFVPIEQVDDPRLAAFRLNERGLASRADKRDDAGAGLFLAEGDLVVERALVAGCEPVLALADAGEWDEVDDLLRDFRVDEFDLATQRDYNLLAATAADQGGDWNRAVRFYESYVLQSGPAEDALAVEHRLRDLAPINPKRVRARHHCRYRPRPRRFGSAPL